jgi:hypothetical protein
MGTSFMKNINYVCKALSTLILSLAMFNCSQGTAEELNLNLYITNGFRRDTFSTQLAAKDPESREKIHKHLKTSPLDMYQLGVKSSYGICGFELRADGNFAWGRNGHLKETTTPVSGSYQDRILADVRSTKVTDFTFGGGFAIKPFSCLALVPMGGVAYNSLLINTKNVRINGIHDSLLNGMRYINRIKGPWIGADVIFNISCFKLRGGYEYHYAHWHGDWKLRRPEPTSSESLSGQISSHSDSEYSDAHRSNNARGQVGYIDARYHFYNCLEIGFGVKYETWRISKGHLRALTEIGEHLRLLPRHPDRVKSLKWNAFAATFDIGFHF